MPATSPRYTHQRAKVTPPHVNLRDLRDATGLTIDGLRMRIEEQTGMRVTRGAISAIENGHRGASRDLLRAIAVAYGMRPDAVTTDYRPRAAQVVA